jgi:tetratricopeptide (TPR) repeat protein
MSYPGNQALAPDVQKRITSTFEHTLGLAADGSRQEALLGCDFVLRMDPEFGPAQQLQERLRASMGAVRVDDLRGTTRGGLVPPAAAPPSPPTAPKTPIAAAETALWHADLDGLALSLPDLPDLHSEPPAGDLRSEIATLLQQRKFQEVAAKSQANHAAVLASPELQHLVQTAQERLEAGPYVVRFLAAARDAQGRRDDAEAERLVEKARSLDPTHPGVLELSPTPPNHHDPSFHVVDDPTTVVDLSPLRTMALPMPSHDPSGGGDAESERRIQQLLEEGDADQAAGDPQAAIDAWSRIFLIDIDHEEAARRIEQARRLKAENERQVEEIYHDGLGAMERGDAAAAKDAFQKVLAMQPVHLGAREYLQQVETQQPAALRDAGKRALGRSAPTNAPTSAVAAPLKAASLPASPTRADGELQEEILVPPDLGDSPRSEPRRDVRGTSRGGSGKRMFFVVGSAVMLLILAVGWFLYQKHEQWFPNSQETTPQPTNDALIRAKRFHDTGKVAIALSQLRRLPPSDPHYKEAQALIAQWEQASGPPGTPPLPNVSLAPVSAGASPIDAHRSELVALAEKAYAGHAYFRAAERFDQADRIARLESNDAANYAEAQQHLLPMAKQVSMFHQHDWEFALPELWKLHQSDPLNEDIRQLMVDCYYDLGVRDLQRMDSRTAIDKFQEGLKLDPNDKGLEHELLFARTYTDRSPDLLYRIYVKYLPLR